jgi:hypothetical protein
MVSLIAQVSGADPTTGFEIALLAILGPPFLIVAGASLGLWWYIDNGWQPSWYSAISFPLGAALIEWGTFARLTGLPAGPDNFPAGPVGLAALTAAALVCGAAVQNRQTRLGIGMTMGVIIALIVAITADLGTLLLLSIGYALLGGAAGYAIAQPSVVKKANETPESTYQ